MLHFNKLMAVLLFVSVTVMGQYTGGFPNVAAFKSTTASEFVTGFEPEKAVDTLLTTYCSVSGDAPAWLQVDLGEGYYIYGFGMILPNAGELPLAVTFQVSTDGISWDNNMEVSVGAEGTYSYNTMSNPARYARFYITAKDPLATFAEVMVYGQRIPPPRAPQALPATGIDSASFTANWTEAVRGEGYILTVATDPDFDNRIPGYGYRDVGNVLSWSITNLDPATTYYYIVRAYNLTGISLIFNVMEVAIDKLTQTISFDPVTEKVYGNAVFELSATASSGLPVSFSNSEETVATINGSTVTIVGAGTTVITATQNGNDLYDTAAPVQQTLVVTVKELTVTGTVVADKVYDASDTAAISGAVLNGVVGDDDVSLENETSGLFAQSDVGVDIEVTTLMTLSGSTSGNYSLILPTGLTADITARELVITAVDASRETCNVNPVFPIEYAGFAGSDDENVLTEAPTATCAADEASPEGTYEIIVSGGTATNYTVTFINGTLTVTPDATNPTLTVSNISVQLDETGNASITPADVVTDASDNCGVVDTTLSQDTFTSDDIGEVSVEVIVTDAAGNSTSAFAVVTVLGTDNVETFSENGVRVYPNPTYGNLEMVFEKSADILKVIDMTGKIILERSNLQIHETFDLSGYSNGIYIFQIKSIEELTHIKVIKR